MLVESSVIRQVCTITCLSLLAAELSALYNIKGTKFIISNNGQIFFLILLSPVNIITLLKKGIYVVTAHESPSLSKSKFSCIQLDTTFTKTVLLIKPANLGHPEFSFRQPQYITHKYTHSECMKPTPGSGVVVLIICVYISSST